MNDFKIYALIVIYNKHCYDSATLKKLKLFSNILQIIIFDNSTSEFGNKDYCREHGYIYFGFHQNFGLSRAYNYVVDSVIDHPLADNGCLMLLDDDTDITEEYISKAIKRIRNKQNFDILLPIVQTGTTEQIIISPANLKFNCGGKSVSSIQDIKMDKITAINSGMIVNLSVYKKIRYNEDLFLDCVDHEFMRNARECGLKIEILDSIIYQNYSRLRQNNKDSAIFRYSIQIKDFRRYAMICNRLWFFRLSMLKLAFEWAFRYRTFVFLKIFFSNCWAL